MAEAGLPVLPGSDGPVTSATAARQVAGEIGYPLIIKAVAGGGGRGMTVVAKPGDFDDAYRDTRSAAQALFGDGRVYIERFVENAKHIEVQVLRDNDGHGIHLGERDCSVQRRHQKLVEETPAPALSEAARNRMCEAAVIGASASGLTGAGTFEFVAEAEDFYFMEINGRIQVEHPVTEEVTGRDLVALQLRIADGDPLGFTQDDVHHTGHAIECRLNAEDVGHGFRPSPGTLSLFAIPDRSGLRVDTHCQAGAVVPPFYDSLLAKLIAHAPERDAAIDTLLDALDEVEVEGVETNRTALISVLGHPDFRDANVSTDWLERVLA
jgi:acetyl-CoA carboxylase biotin carboxylase subunit